MTKPILALLLALSFATLTFAQTADQRPVTVENRNTNVGRFDIGVEKKTYTTGVGDRTTEKYKFRGGIRVYDGDQKEVVIGAIHKPNRIGQNGQYHPGKNGPSATVRWGPGVGRTKIDNHDGRYGTFCKRNCQ